MSIAVLQTYCSKVSKKNRRSPVVLALATSTISLVPVRCATVGGAIDVAQILFGTAALFSASAFSMLNIFIICSPALLSRLYPASCAHLQSERVVLVVVHGSPLCHWRGQHFHDTLVVVWWRLIFRLVHFLIVILFLLYLYPDRILILSCYCGYECCCMS